MHQRAAHYNTECLRCIHLIKIETLEPKYRLFFDEREKEYEMVITCELNHCINAFTESREIDER